jgi:hypothetical protein
VLRDRKYSKNAQKRRAHFPWLLSSLTKRKSLQHAPNALIEKSGQTELEQNLAKNATGKALLG